MDSGIDALSASVTAAAGSGGHGGYSYGFLGPGGGVGNSSSGGASINDLDAMTCLPALSQQSQELFSGPHTQFVSPCFFTQPDGTMVNAMVALTCTQLFVCDAKGFVFRLALLEQMLAIYQRPLAGQPRSHQGPSAGGSSSGGGQPQQEVLLVFDGEHDVLLRGALTCDGLPPKPFIPTLRALHHSHHPSNPVVCHLDTPASLKEMARLRPPPGYIAPLPQKEDAFESCPCWREADVLNISADEFQRRVTNMFTVYAPEKLHLVADVCRKFGKKKGGALQFLRQKYGPEPSQEHAAAVGAMLSRDKHFRDIFPPNDGVGDGTNVSVKQVVAAQRQKSVYDNPLLFSALILANRPSGGLPKVTLTVTPLNEMLPLDHFTCFARRERDVEHELWYLTNEGYVLSFDTSPDNMRPYGFASGDRVLATYGVTSGRWSTIVGVRDGALWAHDQGTVGASALVGFHHREDFERFNGWMVAETSTLNETTTLLCMTRMKYVETIRITPEVVHSRFGFYHGQVVASRLPCSQPTSSATVVGVSPDNVLFVIFEDAADRHYAMSHDDDDDGPDGSRVR